MIAGGLVALPELAAAEAPALALGVQRGVSLLIAAAQGVGEVKGDIHDKIKQTYIDKGVPEAEAAKLAVQSQEYTLKNAPLLIGGAAFGALDAATGFEKSASKALKGAFKGEEKALEGEALNKAVASLGKPMEKPTGLRSFLSTAGEEGATEALQGGFGQAAQNIAMSNEGFETPTMQGVAGAAAHDALIGALTGGAFSLCTTVVRCKITPLIDSYVKPRQRRTSKPPKMKRLNAIKSSRKKLNKVLACQIRRCWHCLRQPKLPRLSKILFKSSWSCN
jgi:hypothetical protein